MLVSMEDLNTLFQHLPVITSIIMAFAKLLSMLD
jgi:hypothetical protein